jgi:hypothetical protein
LPLIPQDAQSEVAQLARGTGRFGSIHVVTTGMPQPWNKQGSEQKLRAEFYTLIIWECSFMHKKGDISKIPFPASIILTLSFYI